MAKRQDQKPAVGSTGVGSWGRPDDPKQHHLPSGQKLVFREEDQDCILKFMGTKDITQKMIEKGRKLDEGEKIFYFTFFDGKRVVSMPSSYALSDFDFKVNGYYYMHLTNLLPMAGDFNDFKDFSIYFLGMEGETGLADKNRIGVDSILLNAGVIAELNYSKLNYPLRKV